MSWWKGDGNALDSVGGNHGTLYNVTNYASGEVQQAFTFNGVNQWVEIPDSPSLNPTNALTVEVWVYVSGNPNTDVAAVIYKFSPVDVSLNKYQIATHYINGQLHFYPVIMLPGWTYFDGKTVIQFNTWYHVAMTYDGSSLSLYVNGALDGSIAASGPIIPKPVPLRIGGASTGPWFFNGRVDEVSLYDRALTASEVQAIYLAGSAGKCFAPTLPAVTVQPANQSAPLGGMATFTATATGTGPLSYQWLFGSVNIAGATNSTLTITNLQFANAGVYSIMVSNSVGAVISSTATLTVTGGSCVPPSAGLVSWWKGDGNALDSVGGNHGTPYNVTNYAPGEVQQAFTFNGVNQWVEIPDSPSLNPTNALTVEAWVYVSGNPNTDFASVIYKFSPVDVSLNQYQIATHYINGQLHFFPIIMLPGWTDFDGKTLIQFNTWYRVAMTYDGSSLSLYVNGALDGSIAASGPIIPKPVPLRIGGASTGPWFFNGRVDEVSLYDRALSASEIQAVYNAGASGKCPTSVAPTFEVQPQNVSATVAGNATLSTVVAGSLPMTLQWWFNSVPVPGGTNSALSLSNISQADAGPYYLVAMNSAGSVTSSVATLTVTLGPSLVQIAAGTVAGDGSVTVPLNLVANGSENAASFSIDFDPTLLTYQGAASSTGASNGSLLINSSQVASGRVGVAIAMPTGITFGVGAQQIAVVSFTASILPHPTVTTLSFGDAPIPRLVVSPAGLQLQANFAPGSLTIPASAMEGDVFPRPAGDGSLNISDWVQVGRFVAGLDSPTNGVEFQRADCAPRSTLGDGALTVSDWVQAGRYAAGLDPAVRAGGPTSAMPAVVVGAVRALSPKSGNARQVSLVAPVLSLAETGYCGSHGASFGQRERAGL